MSEFDTMPQPTSELREYPDGRVDEVFKTHGDKFNMGKLVDELLDDPIAEDAGVVCVQTKGVDGQGNEVRSMYFFNDRLFLDPQRNQAVLMDQLDPSNRNYDITVGSHWYSPIGPTHTVTAILRPWTRGYDSATAVQGRKSPTASGKQRIDAVLAANNML